MTLQLAPDLALGDDFAGEASAILARRGRGKTYTASVLAEELHAAGQPFAVLDPVGVWYGLRSSPDGTKPGLPVTILGGEHGDVPLEATAGGLVYATDAGVEALGDGYEPLPTGADLQAYWLDRLPEGEAAVLRILVDAWPAGVARETISDGTGYKRSTRDTYLQRLRARKLVTGDREPCAADTLFDEGI